MVDSEKPDPVEPTAAPAAAPETAPARGERIIFKWKDTAKGKIGGAFREIGILLIALAPLEGYLNGAHEKSEVKKSLAEALICTAVPAPSELSPLWAIGGFMIAGIAVFSFGLMVPETRKEKMSKTVLAVTGTIILLAAILLVLALWKQWVPNSYFVQISKGK